MSREKYMVTFSTPGSWGHNDIHVIYVNSLDEIPKRISHFIEDPCEMDIFEYEGDSTEYSLAKEGVVGVFGVEVFEYTSFEINSDAIDIKIGEDLINRVKRDDKLEAQRIADKERAELERLRNKYCEEV